MGAKKGKRAARPKKKATKPKKKVTPIERKSRPLRFNRKDRVRFRKRSRIARGLGVSGDKTFAVERIVSDGGRRFVVLRVGSGKHSALIQVPPGHLAIVERAIELPPELKSCAARLAELEGVLPPKTRHMLAEMSKRA